MNPQRKDPKSRGIAPARMAAFHALLALDRSDSVHTDELLRSPQVDRMAAADRHLVTALVMGVLRWQLVLDARIRPLLKRGGKLDAEVAAALRLGAFQLLYMDRIPAHAAIHDSVELLKRAGHRFASGMVNAVLRKLAQEPRRSDDSGTVAAHPAWMTERWSAQWGEVVVAAICGYDQQPAPVALRVPDEASARALDDAGILVKEGEFLTRARVLTGGDLFDSGFATAAIRIQDEGSQLIAELAGQGRRMLDCCAAPGGKTAILAERNPEADITACDISQARVAEMEKSFARNPITRGIRTLVLDATELPLEGEYDRILCDVPCSGTGTLARHPEIKLRLRPDEFARQAERQVAILNAAMRKLAPGGRLIYSTCSLEPEENEAVLRRALADHSEYSVVPVERCLNELAESGVISASGLARLRSSAVQDGLLRTIPGVLPCDGFFAAILTRPGGRASSVRS